MATEVIDTGYTIDFMTNLDHWTIIREMAQNAADGEIEHGAKMAVAWNPSNGGTLVIANNGATMPRQALATGWSTKRGRSDLRGKKGFGLKQAAIAACRLGIDFQILNGNETWKFFLQMSKSLHTETIHVRISSTTAMTKSVRVAIPCTKDQWATYEKRFLFLQTLNANEAIKTEAGTLLLNQLHAGMLFVQGIYVSRHSAKFGYDFPDADILDVERRMVESYERDSTIRRIWELAIAQRPDLFSKFNELMSGGAAEMNDYRHRRPTKQIEDLIVADFKRIHGDEAIPVSSIEEGASLEHLGRIGGFVSNPVHLAVLQRVLGTAAKIKEEMKDAVVKRYGWPDLDETERANLRRACDLTEIAFPEFKDNDEQAAGSAFSLTDIVGFHESNTTTLGMFKDGRCLLSKPILKDRALTLETMVHEFAHRKGGDGEHKHVAEIERAWSRIVEYLSDNSK